MTAAAAPGSGPGPITPDGCAVDLYAALTARDVPDEELPGLLAAADLRLDRVLTDDGSWFVAVPTAAKPLRPAT